ncbi:hypothetical protein CMV_016428 [Castanea mollissima]|uniref:Uncharacterized protein n=1 Tax=Castanea mollissima TaxID=60419 RepID=A0A8J4R808_9ROSI|nr:hypothetical protein CMV_016428 [Castanea mollissima]
MSEADILEVVIKNFDDRFILGEEGGIIGDTSSDYLWCIDPLGVGPIEEMMIDRHKTSLLGAPCVGTSAYFLQLLVGEHSVMAKKFIPLKLIWVVMLTFVHMFGGAIPSDLFKQFTDVSREARAAAVDMCHVALGIAESYWESRLKLWDMAAAALGVGQGGFSKM